MASPKGEESSSGASDLQFPVADVDGELNPGRNTNFQVDRESSQVATSMELKEKAEALERKEKEKENKDGAQKLKKAIIGSGVIVAVIGAAFAIIKKLRET